MLASLFLIILVARGFQDRLDAVHPQYMIVQSFSIDILLERLTQGCYLISSLGYSVKGGRRLFTLQQLPAAMKTLENGFKFGSKRLPGSFKNAFPFYKFELDQ